MDHETVPSLAERMTEIRNCSSENVVELISTLDLLPRLPTDHLDTLDHMDRIICLRAALLCYCVTNGTQVPRKMQLQAVLADQHGNDYLVAAGTGSGKTLPMALNILLEDPSKNSITLTLSPLKRLQSTQGNDFNSRYGIPTVVINEDTPRDDTWWSKHVYDTKKNLPGLARHLIVTVEQLFKSREGHFPRLYLLVRNARFQRLINRLNVDEAHHIYTAGLPHYGLDAFRSAWGKLDELKAILPRTVKVGAYSATATPPHILKTIELKILRPNYELIHLTSNRCLRDEH